MDNKVLNENVSNIKYNIMKCSEEVNRIMNLLDSKINKSEYISSEYIKYCLQYVKKYLYKTYDLCYKFDYDILDFLGGMI